MQIAQSRLSKISPVFFLLVGVIWLAVVITSGELVLLWPALTSILSGIAFYVGATKWLRRPLGISSCLFGLAVALFQLFLAAALVGTELAGLAVYSLVTFVVLTLLELTLLYTAAKT